MSTQTELTLPPGATFVRTRDDHLEVWESRRQHFLVRKVGRYNDRDGGRRVVATREKVSTV